MPNGNGNSSKKPKPKAKKPAARAAAPQQNMLQRAEGAIQGAGKSIGAAWDRSQQVKRNIYKGMGGQTGKGQ